MKYIFPILIFLHGSIHILGFVKGFKIIEISNIQDDISIISGIFWISAFLLFAVAANAFYLGKDFWFYFAGPAIIISSILIAGTWGDAKYGMVPNVIILVVAIFSFSSCSMNKMITRETEEILEAAKASDPAIITDAAIQELPASVQQWMHNTGIIGKPSINTAFVNQKARMKMKPTQQDWYAAEAEQFTTVDPPAFIWTVNMKMSPLIKVRGRDKFVDGRGEMLIKMNSIINVVNEKGPRMDEGTLQRFLGELVWFPSLALSPYIEWEAIDKKNGKSYHDLQRMHRKRHFLF